MCDDPRLDRRLRLVETKTEPRPTSIPKDAILSHTERPPLSPPASWQQRSTGRGSEPQIASIPQARPDDLMC
eukprot:7658046-Pyramimonas_sp.AAC.1